MELNINSDKIDKKENKKSFGGVNNEENNNLRKTASSLILQQKQQQELQQQQPQINTEPILSSVQKYELEWETLSGISTDPELLELRQIAVDGELKISKFRSICWSLLLGVIRNDSKSWLQQRRYDRNRYIELKRKYFLNPHKVKDYEDDPLSQAKTSVWNQHFCDKELCGIIQQDVIRTFPGVDFYRKTQIQEIMINILFCYARQHPHISYRQGMHEILAPILFVLHCDHQALLHIREMKMSMENNIEEILDPHFLEEDSFYIFNKIMKNIEPFYRINNFITSSNDYFSSVVKQCPSPPPQTSPQQQPLATSSNSVLQTNVTTATSSPLTPDIRQSSEIEVVSQLNFIRDKILAKEDLHLHNHLLKLDIPLPIFGIRWLRLLFGREFSLQELLILWDAIFADSDRFELTNFIVVAMLIRIRDKLLLGDYTTCLMYLMKYPTNVDINVIIKHALHMRTPSKYPIPDGAFVYISVNKKQLFDRNHSNRISSSSSSSSSSTNLLKKSNNNNVAGMINCDNKDQQKRSINNNHLHHYHHHHQHNNNNNNHIIDEQLQNRITALQNASALATMKFVSEAQYLNYDTEPGIVDGYLEDSPDLLKLELQNANTVMTISRIKLTQYLGTLRKSIITQSHSSSTTNVKSGKNNSVLDDVQQSLDGIEEVCALLNHKIYVPYKKIVPVDKAFEADEAGAGNTRKLSQQSSKLNSSNEKNATVINNNNNNNKAKNNNITFMQKRFRKYNEHESKTHFVRQLASSNFETQGIIDIDPNNVNIDDNDDDFETHSEPIENMRSGTNKTNNNNNNNNHSSSNCLRSNSMTRYEIPENQLTRIAVKILGNRKEFEMHEFRGAGGISSGDQHSRNFSDNNDGIGGDESSKRFYLNNMDDGFNVMPNIDPSRERCDDSPIDD